MIRRWIRKYFGSVRLFLTILAIIWGIAAFYVHLQYKPLDNNILMFLGGIFAQLVTYTIGDSLRKSDD